MPIDDIYVQGSAEFTARDYTTVGCEPTSATTNDESELICCISLPPRTNERTLRLASIVLQYTVQSGKYTAVKMRLVGYMANCKRKGDERWESAV